MDSGYEIGLLAHVLREGVALPEVVEGLSFRLEPAQHAWALCQMAWRRQAGRQKRLPTVSELRHAVAAYSQGHDPVYQALVLQLLDALEVIPTTPYTADELSKIVQETRAAKVAADIQEALQGGKDLSKLLPDWSQRLNLTMADDSRIEWIDLEDIAALSEMEAERMGEAGAKTIPLCIPNFDRRTRGGGLHRSDVMVLLGATGTGKTTVMMGLTALVGQQGFNVLSVPLEDSPLEILERLEATVPNESVAEDKGPRWREDFHVRYYHRIRRFGGRIIIPRRPIKKPWRVRQLWGAVDMAEEKYGCHIDMVMLDHLDEVSAQKDYKDKNHLSFKEMISELSDFAQQRQTIIVTASQGTRASHKAEVPHWDHIAEGHTKTEGATQFIAICMTPAQRETGAFGLAVLKNRRARNGEVNYIIPMRMDFSRQSIWPVDGPVDRITDFMTAKMSARPPGG